MMADRTEKDQAREKVINKHIPCFGSGWAVVEAVVCAVLCE